MEGKVKIVYQEAFSNDQLFDLSEGEFQEDMYCHSFTEEATRLKVKHFKFLHPNYYKQAHEISNQLALLFCME